MVVTRRAPEGYTPARSQSKTPFGGLMGSKPLSTTVATVGGAALFGLVEYYAQGFATTNWKKTLTYAALGGLAGFTSSTALTQSSYWAQKSGGANWAVGDEFTLATDSTETVYSLSAITVDSNVATQATLGFSPILAETIANNQLGTKEGPAYGTGYKGNQRSMENHIRLRNQGQI